jgi:ribosome-associated protein
MQTFRLRTGDEFIRLGQVLKASAIAESGADAKDMIQSGIVSVNGENETRRGRKLYPGDTVSVNGEELQIQAAL